MGKPSIIFMLGLFVVAQLRFRQGDHVIHRTNTGIIQWDTQLTTDEHSDLEWSKQYNKVQNLGGQQHLFCPWKIFSHDESLSPYRVGKSKWQLPFPRCLLYQLQVESEFRYMDHGTSGEMAHSFGFVY